jgi:hypothetical protein
MKLKQLPPGGAYLIGVGLVTLALMGFGGYLFYRSQQVSLNTGALIAVPLVAIVVLWLLMRTRNERD